MPDWVFRLVGASAALTYFLTRIPEYREFPDIGPWWAEPIGTDAFGMMQYGERHYFPIAKILTDLTFLTIALSYCLRLPPRERAHTARQIVVPLLGGVWPFLPFIAFFALEALGNPAAAHLNEMLGFRQIGIGPFYVSVAVLSLGLLLDVWGYWTLLPSLSVVAEARELKLTGPYRFVRHPIYLGQIVSQAALWLLLIRWSWLWVAFVAAFITIQLYRARVEESVLEEAFGDVYCSYKQRTFWFA